MEFTPTQVNSETRAGLGRSRGQPRTTLMPCAREFEERFEYGGQPAVITMSDVNG
jgi:hypothetical protein